MKIRSLIIATFLLFGFSSAQATEQFNSPEIFKALASDSVQAMSATEAMDIRGEKWTLKEREIFKKRCLWGFCVTVSAGFETYWVPTRVQRVVNGYLITWTDH